MSRKRFVLGAALISVVALIATSAVAQPATPNPQPGPHPAQPQPAQIQPRPIQMPGQMPGRQPGLPPGFPRPQLGPGQPMPGGMPGGMPSGRMPPGHPPVRSAPVERVAPEEKECPGHGPLDTPPTPNWYQGLLGINNEKAESPSQLDRLLWRYHNEKNECDPKNQDPPLLAALINFGIMIFLLFRFGGTPLRDGLIKRKKTIMEDIDAADHLRSDAEARLKKYEKQLVNIGERRRELAADYQAEFEAEKKRILAEAEEKRVRIRRDAEFRVTQELRQAEAELLSEATEGAVRAAEELIKTRVQQADMDRLAEEYLSGIGQALKTSSQGQSASAAARGGES